MKKLRITALCLCISAFSIGLIAQDSQLFDDLSLKSEILKKDKKYSIYLPAGYNTSDQSYPVVYLLHGAGGEPNKHQDWIKHGNMKTITDRAISSGKIKPMIIVMPDAEMTYYMNNAKGEYQFEDFFMQELIPYIEANYRTMEGKKYRGLAGLSMGGFGALVYGLHHPDIFSAAAGLSSGIRTNKQIKDLSLNGYLQRYRIPMGELKAGDKRITDFWNANSPLYLVDNTTKEELASVRFYIDIGNEDAFVKGNAQFHKALQKHKILHEYRVRDGKHNWEFWKTGLADALEFISAGFN